MAFGQRPALDELDPGTKAALDRVFPSPNPTWVPAAQPFWPDYRVFKLLASSWYHRPTVAVGRNGQVHLLTDNVLRLSPQRTLAHFNQINLEQRVQITPDNVQEFAAFFLRGFLLYSDDSCLSSLPPPIDSTRFELTKDICSEPQPFKIVPEDDHFVVQTVLVHRRAVTAYSREYAIDRNGQIQIRRHQ
ncbi:MAG: hypothetical protein AB1898_12770 [Acidobacteriota bacterium]